MAVCVNIAELKNRLSAYLVRVRAGEEIIIRDRNLPVAKLVPLTSIETSAEELALVASGDMRLPLRELDDDAFWKLGRDVEVAVGTDDLLVQAISRDREESDDRILGR